MNDQQRIELQILELHLLVAEELERRPAEAIAFARAILAHWRSIRGDHPYYREWEEVLDRGAAAVIALCRDRSEHAILLRSVSPIGSFLLEERDAIFFRRPPMSDEEMLENLIDVKRARALAEKAEADRHLPPLTPSE